MKKRTKRLILWTAKGMKRSCRNLKQAMLAETQRRILIVRSRSKTFRPRLSDYTVNWGNSAYSENWLCLADLNKPPAVRRALNKLTTLTLLQENNVNVPEFTTDIDTARQWVEDGNTVIGRKTLTGFGGQGIEVYDADNPVEDCPLYTKYKKKKHEYRVHVFNGETIDISQKRKRKGFEDDGINTKIRNCSSGWVFCRENLQIPEDLTEQAIAAVHALGLNFGAVDIIWNARENKSYVLEVNTAPGIEGTSVELYKQAILKELDNG